MNPLRLSSVCAAGCIAITACIVSLASSSLHAQPSGTPLDRFWRTDGPVYAIHVTSNRVYLGGQFTYVGPAAGGAGLIDIATGRADTDFPIINGPVLSAAADGQGGWYIGGSFSMVGGIQISNLAHIRADLTVDPEWRPQPNGSNTVIIVSGGVVYVGGGFTRIGGQIRNRLAALDVTTGQLAAWNPNAAGVVNTMLLDGTTFYVGGAFTTIGGQNRARIAAVDARTGEISAWNPGASAGAVFALAKSGNTLYISGTFTTAGGKPRNRIAALTIDSNDSTDWNPNASAPGVFTIAVAGNIVYAGGGFTTIGSQTRNRIAALDATTGLATDWNPDANGNVSALLVSGSTIYAAGTFTRIGGQPRALLAALDAATGQATSWLPGASELGTGVVPYVGLLRLTDGRVLVGGSFASIGGLTRNHIAALDVQTGEATDWNPNANTNVTALLAVGNTVYAGGIFTNIGGMMRRRLAGLLATTGEATTWDPNVLGRATVGIFALAADNDRLYVGGNFTNVGGMTRNSIAAFGRQNGVLIPAWNPNAMGAQATVSASVNALLLDGNTLYAGGDFLNIGGQPRARLAVLTASSAAVGSWNPGVSNAVNALAIAGNTLYVGGALTNVGGQARSRLAAVDTTTAVPTLWNPDPSGAQAVVRALVVANNSVYVGGQFTQIAGEFRNRLAGILRSVPAQAHDWNPNANNLVRTLFRTPDAIYVGGDFTAFGTSQHAYFAAFSAAPVFVPETVQRLPNGSFTAQLTSGDGARVIVQRTTNFDGWTDVSTHTDLNGSPFTFTDAGAAGQPRRHYRAVLETE